MAFCSQCGKELADGAQFCAACGTGVSTGVFKNPKEIHQRNVYDGKIFKCPNCGEQLDAFVAICPACGYELRGTQSTSCVHELSKILECTASMEKKDELIRNFYIPNTKEDIYEFFILAYSNITAGAYGIDAWKVKLEQAYLKAKLAFNDDGDFKYINELYKQIKTVSIKNKILKSKWFKATFTFSVGLILMLGGFLIPPIFSIENNSICGPLYFIGLIGMLPFFAGIIMYIIPERMEKQRK